MFCLVFFPGKPNGGINNDDVALGGLGFGIFRAARSFLMYCVKAKYFMIRNTLNYVWENTIDLYGLFEDHTPLRFSIFAFGFASNVRKLL